MNNKYKKLIFFPTLFVILNKYSFSQQQEHSIKFELNQSKSNQSKEYVARDYIIFYPGYQFNGYSAGKLIARIDPYQLFNAEYTPEENVPEVDTITINTLSPVDEFQGIIDVSQTGAAIYTIPIEIPSGTNNLQPNISIVYNSQSGNNILGWGWYLQAYSSISRCSQSKYYDDKITTITLTDNDRLMIDGIRLILKEGQYLMNNSSYIKEINDFSEIKFLSLNEGFVVTTKDGTKWYYGQNEAKLIPESTSIPITWYVSKICDRFGNYIQFIYDNSNSEVVLKEINYTGNDILNTPPFYKIQFFYEIKREKNVSYIKGFKIRNSKILKKINILFNNSLLTQYEFHYFYDNYYSKLYKISKMIKNNESIIYINYRDNDQEVFNFSPQNINVNNNLSEYCKAITCDLNNDNKSDIIAFDCEDDIGMYKHIDLYVNENNSFVSKYRILTGNSDYYLINIYKNYDFLGSSGLYVNDFTGDYKNDLAVVEISANDNNLMLEDIKIYYSLFDPETPTTDYFSITPVVEFLTKNSILCGDFDGNGFTDFILCTRDANGFILPSLYLPSINKSFALIGCLDFGNDFANASISQILNFNNNSKEDILLYNEGPFSQKFLRIYELNELNKPDLIFSTQWDNNYEILGFGDFNGDFLTDVFVKDLSNSAGIINRYCILFNKVNGFYYDPEFNTLSICNTAQFETICDLNGDGLSDVIFKEQNTFSDYISMFCYINKTYEFSFFMLTFNSPNKFIKIGDFDGNGTSDILCKENYLYNIYYANYNNAFVRKIIDNYGKKIFISYSTLSDPLCYNQSNTLQFKTYPLLLVKEINYHYGQLQDRSLFYYYDGLAEKDKNIPFMGFSKIIHEQQNTKLRLITHYTNQIGEFKGIIPVKYSKCYYQDTWLLSEEDSINFGIIAHQNLKSFFVYPHIIIKYNYLNSTNLKIINNVDEWGNIINSEELRYYGTILDIRKEITNTYTTAGLNIPHKLASSTISITYKDQSPYIQSSYYTYDNNTGALNSKFTDSILTSYTYYPRGAIKTITSYATGLPQLTTYFEYDPTERFVTRITNPMGFQICKTYDIGRGLLLSETDINNRVTKYEYDDLNNLRKTIYPDGNITEQKIEWYNDISNPDVHHVVTITPSNGPYLKTYFDILNRAIKTETVDALNRKIYTHKKYNYKYQLIEESDHYYEGEIPKVITYEYKPDGRIMKKHIWNIKTLCYYYNCLTTTISDEVTSVITSTTTNTAGQIIETTDAGGKIYTTYNSMGKPAIIKVEYHSPSEPQVITILYDNFGRQRFLHDPNAGTTEYKYNYYGQLVYQKDARGNTFTMQYDLLDRLIKKTGPEGTYYYYYDEDPYNKGMLSREVSPEGQIITYSYDKLGRLIKKSINYDNKLFEFSFTYNNAGNIEKLTYPVGFSIKNIYNNNGYLIQIRNDITDQPIWQLLYINSKGQITKAKSGNNLLTHYQYDENYYLTDIKTGTVTNHSSIQHYQYQFDPVWGRPTYRLNNYGYFETFSYDDTPPLLKLNRLTQVNVEEHPEKNTTIYYYPNGNIAYKTGVGVYDYDSYNRPNAVQYIQPWNVTDVYAPHLEQNISWTSFNQPSEITEGNYRLTFYYGINQQRIKTQLYNQNQLTKTKYFADNYEQVIENNEVKHLYFVYAPTGLAAIMVKDNQHPQGMMYYIHSDHLGNITEITDEQGNLVQRLWYNAWGERELLVDNTGTGKPLFDRGYTTHEHLDEFGLINMNGRLYDPKLSQFLSPDNFVSDATSTQAYNRYAYALNNPMVYSDPSGECIHLVVGAIIGGTVNWAIHGAEFTWKGLGYFTIGAIAGAVGAGVGAGVAVAYAGGSFGAGFIGSASVTSSTLGFTGGFVSGFAGGFSSGFVSGIGNSLISGNNFVQSVGAGVNEGLKQGLIGGCIGGLVGGFSSYYNNKNVWTGDDVEIGRSQFSFNNTPVPEDQLYYIDEYGNTYSVSQYNDPVSKRINVRREITLQRINQKIDLEEWTEPTEFKRSPFPKIPNRKGFAGIEYDPLYLNDDKIVVFKTNTGITKVINTVTPGKFSFNPGGVKYIDASIYGIGNNLPYTVNYPFSYRIIIRIKY